MLSSFSPIWRILIIEPVAPLQIAKLLAKNAAERRPRQNIKVSKIIVLSKTSNPQVNILDISSTQIKDVSLKTQIKYENYKIKIGIKKQVPRYVRIFYTILYIDSSISATYLYLLFA